MNQLIEDSRENTFCVLYDVGALVLPNTWAQWHLDILFEFLKSFPGIALFSRLLVGLWCFTHLTSTAHPSNV